MVQTTVFAVEFKSHSNSKSLLDVTVPLPGLRIDADVQGRKPFIVHALPMIRAFDDFKVAQFYITGMILVLYRP